MDDTNPTPTQPETLEPPEVIHVTFCSKCGRTRLHNTRCSKCGNKLGFEDEIAYLRQLEQLSPELVERVANYLEGNRHDNPLVLAHALRRAAVTAPRGDVAQRRLEIALGYIKRAANRELPKLPCRVDEMTEREVAIFNVGAAAVGNLQFIARELDALPAAATSSPTPAEFTEDIVGDYVCDAQPNCGWRSSGFSRPLSRGTKVGCPNCLGNARFIGATSAPAERTEVAEEQRLLTPEELADIERFQRQRRKGPVPTDAWLYVAEIDRLLTHIRLDREQLENEIFQDATDPAFTSDSARLAAEWRDEGGHDAEG